MVSRQTGLTALLVGAAIGLTALTGCSAKAEPSAAAAPDERVVAAGGVVADKPLKGFPRGANTGVPRHWTPRKTVRGDLTITKDGAVVKDVRVYGNLMIEAKNVRVMRVDVVGGWVRNNFDSCGSNLKLIRTTIRADPDRPTDGAEFPAVGEGSYTARRVKILGMPEGFRIGSKDLCGGVRIRDSFVRVKNPPNCASIDWHGDALQGYGGGHLKIRNTRLILDSGPPPCEGTAAFWYPAEENNTSVDVDGLIVEGGGYSFRLHMPGVVRNLKVVQGSWLYGPVDVTCDLLSDWDAAIVKLDGKGQPTTVRRQSCK